MTAVEVDGGTKLDVPEVIPRARVKSDEIPVGVTGEHQSAGGRQRSSVGRREILEPPFLLASRTDQSASMLPEGLSPGLGTYALPTKSCPARYGCGMALNTSHSSLVAT